MIPDGEGNFVHVGTDEMPERLATWVDPLKQMREGSPPNPMYHIHVPKNGGGDVLAVMDARELWFPTALMFYKQHGGAEWVALLADAFVRIFEKEERGGRPHLAVGELERMRAGGDTKVMDAMIVTVRDDSGWEGNLQLPYLVADDGNLIWDDPRWFTTDDEAKSTGFVSDCLQVLLGHRTPSPREVAEALIEMRMAAGAD